MKFNVLVAIIATISLAATANAQNDTTVSESSPAQGVVIMNSNTSTQTAAQATTQQPVTVVEAAPVSESKAELMRKARQGEEVKTEQKIVEKLEESRLKEEQLRAERLFGNKLDTPANTATATATAVVVEAKPEVKEDKATHVTIEKVEIVQPAAVVKEEKEEKVEAASSKMEIAEVKEAKSDRFFVGAILAAPNYNTSNVKTNYGLGVSVGMNLSTDWSIEGAFLYSNHSVDTYWTPGLFKDLDQFDVSASAKYYILSGRLKPYLGGSVTYIHRVYADRIYGWNGPSQATGWANQETDAVNLGLLGGVDFEISKQILIGAGLDYSFNVMNKNDFSSIYSANGMPNTRPLEEIDYYTVKVSAKYLF